MVKHTQTFRRQQSTNCLSVFDHFMGLGLKGLRFTWQYLKHIASTFNAIEIRFFEGNFGGYYLLILCPNNQKMRTL